MIRALFNLRRSILRTAARRFFSHVRRLPADRSASAAIEFAIVIFPFLAFTSLILQVAFYHFGLQSLNAATNAAARLVMIGQIPANAQSAAQFKAKYICSQSMLSMDCNNLTLNVYKVEPNSNEAASTGIYRFIDTQTNSVRPANGEVSFCLGGPGDYVFLDATYRFPLFFSAFFPGQPWTVAVMRSSAFFRNEPFNPGGTSC